MSQLQEVKDEFSNNFVIEGYIRGQLNQLSQFTWIPKCLE